MSYNHYSISIHFAKGIIASAQRNGLDTEVLLRESGLNQDLLNNPEVRITPLQLSRLMQAFWREADDEYLGLSSQPSRSGVFSLVANQVIHSGNLRQVYRQTARFLNLVAPAIEMELQEGENDARFILRMTDPSLDPEYILTDFLMMVWHRFPSWLIGKRVPLKAVNFRFPRPDHHEEYRLMFPCPAEFEQQENCFIFDRSYLNEPVVQTKQNLRSYLARAPLDWFKRQSYYPVYTRKVLDYLENAESMAETSMENIATQIHTTTRTLRRKLNEEGTSFQELKDGVRRDEAIHMLSQPGVPISEIARELGFAEAAAFTRAFKQWTGISPSVYRRSKS